MLPGTPILSQKKKQESFILNPNKYLLKVVTCAKDDDEPMFLSVVDQIELLCVNVWNQKNLLSERIGEKVKDVSE